MRGKYSKWMMLVLLVILFGLTAWMFLELERLEQKRNAPKHSPLWQP